MKPHISDLDLPPELRVLLPGQGKKGVELQEDNIYKMAGESSFPEMKTFYQKVDPVAPYATTALMQHQQVMKQQVNMSCFHMTKLVFNVI